MSTLVVSNISDGTTTVGASYVTNGSAKAWSYVDQNGTQTLKDSLNVSSITDSGTGLTSIAFSSAMANANYGALGGNQSGTASGVLDATLTTTSYTFRGCARNDSFTVIDVYIAVSAVFGELA